MKKINESDTQAIIDKIASGRTQMINADKEINALGSRVNDIQKKKMDLEKAIAQEEQKLASAQGETAETNQQQQQEQGDKTNQGIDKISTQLNQASVQNSGNIVESLLSTDEEPEATDENYMDRLRAEYDRLSDELVTLQQQPTSKQSSSHEELIWHLKREIYELENTIEEETNNRFGTPKTSEDNYDSNGYRLSEANDQERFSGQFIQQGNGAMYKDGKKVGYETTEHTPKPFSISDSQMSKSDELEQEKRELEYDIDGIDDNIQYHRDEIAELTDSPEGQEEADAEILGHGWNVLDYLNGGGTSLKELKKLGVPIGREEEILSMYQFAHPDDVKLEKERVVIRKSISKLQKEKSKIETKVEKIDQKLSKIWATKYKSSRRFKSNKSDAKGSRPEVGYVKEASNPMSVDNFYTVSEAYVDDITFNDKPSSTKNNSEAYLFYVKISEDHNEFIGKIFKLSPDGEWYGIVKDGKDKTFEKISYDASYNEDDIVKFLLDSYDEVEIINIEEFNNYIDGDVDSSDWEVKDIEESGITGLKM